MRGSWRFRSAPEIVFGRGVVQQIGDIVRQLSAQRVLLITDQILVAAGLHEKIEQSLAEVAVALDRFDDGPSNATLNRVAACMQEVRNTLEQEPDTDRDDDEIEALLGWIDADRKHGALKKLQGMAWKRG